MDPKSVENAERLRKFKEELNVLTPLQQFGLLHYMQTIRRAGVRRQPANLIKNAKTC